ncbi:MAG: hypothetical protein FJ363_07280 [Gemmatimonadetes bacterium]|nr:hypothetical protein [Gemmatimonadota bacterium]
MPSLLTWLEARHPTAPTALRQRIAELIASHPEWEALSRAEAMLQAGELLMRDVLAAAPKDRVAALDLLAADACVTYAFEAAADAPSDFVARADEAMQRIARLAATRA